MEFVTTETVPGREIQETLGIARGNTVKALDILLALKGEDSSKRILRLRVSSILKYAFAWNVNGSHRIITDGVRYSA